MFFRVWQVLSWNNVRYEVVCQLSEQKIVGGAVERDDQKQFVCDNLVSNAPQMTPFIFLE